MEEPHSPSVCNPPHPHDTAGKPLCGYRKVGLSTLPAPPCNHRERHTDTAGLRLLSSGSGRATNTLAAAEKTERDKEDSMLTAVTHVCDERTP